MKRRDLFLLALYILFLIFYILFSKDLPPEMRLATGKLNELPFLCLIYKTFSIALVVYLVASQIMYDLKYIASSIFTMINKKHWLKEKRIVLLLLVIVIRLNFLLLTNDIFNIIFDMIYYIMIVYSVIYLIRDKHLIKYIYAIIWAAAVILVENNVVFLIINLVLILLT